MGGKEAKVTMELKVNLECEKCYKKVKKVLCKFPQIRDQMFYEKQKTVIITVVCCSPEKIRDKLCCKGGGSIKSIKIIEPKKPEATTAQKPEDDKDNKCGKQKPKEDPGKPKRAPAHEKPKPEPGPMPVAVAVAVQGYPPAMYPPPVPTCCRQCHGGVPGGPCYHMFGGQAYSIQYDGYYGRPVYDSCSGGHNYNHSCYEDNPNACSVM